MPPARAVVAGEGHRSKTPLPQAQGLSLAQADSVAEELIAVS